MIEYNYEMEQADQKIEMLARLRLDLIKIIYESMGIDYGKTENQISYRNYMVDGKLMISGGFSGGMFGAEASSSAINLEAFKNLDVAAFRKYASGGYLTNINSVIKNRTINISSVPKFFMETAITVGRQNNVPPAFFILISGSEAGFRDCPLIKVSPGACGGYFGNNYLYYPSHGAPLSEQMKGPIKSWNDAKRSSPGAGIAELLALGYMCHHLPAVGTKYWKVTGGRIWNTNPDFIHDNILRCYTPPSATQLAEAISTCISAQYMAIQLSARSDLLN